MVSFYQGLLICALIGLMLQHGANCGNVAVNTVSVESQDNILSITVTYTAGPETTVRWANLDNGVLDYEEDRHYANGAGYLTVRLNHEEFAKPKSGNSLRWFVLENLDCGITLNFPPISRLIALAPVFQDFGYLSLVLKKGNDRSIEPGATVALQRREKLAATLSSPELPGYVAYATVEHMLLQKDIGGFPTLRDEYRPRSDRDMNLADDWTGNDTTKEYAMSFNREDSISGILKLSVRLDRRDRSTLIPLVRFTQTIYLVRTKGHEAVPNNTVALYHPRYPLYTEFDMGLTLTFPKFHITAVGNPLPTFSLFRACSGQIPSEVEMYKTILKSRYEAVYYFRFKNATDAVEGSYTLVARSGLTEAREIVTIGILRG